MADLTSRGGALPSSPLGKRALPTAGRRHRMAASPISAALCRGVAGGIVRISARWQIKPIVQWCFQSPSRSMASSFSGLVSGGGLPANPV
jgi:hypothetical protein